MACSDEMTIGAAVAVSEAGEDTLVAGIDATPDELVITDTAEDYLTRYGDRI